MGRGYVKAPIIMGVSWYMVLVSRDIDKGYLMRTNAIDMNGIELVMRLYAPYMHYVCSE